MIELLKQHQLLGRTGGGLPREHPIIREIEDVVRSAQGRAAANGAADAGLPALAGVDPLIQARLGHDYGCQDTMNRVEFLVAEVMRELGYKETGNKLALPPGSIAKKAERFVEK